MGALVKGSAGSREKLNGGISERVCKQKPEAEWGH